MVSMQTLIVVSLLLFGLSCRQSETITEQKAEVLNAFDMFVNNQAWQPSKLGEDDCMQTFQAAWSTLGSSPFFTAWAYKDAKGVTTNQSQNAFQLQIIDVQRVGQYRITGSYKTDFAAYVLFRINKPDGTSIRYVNDDKGSFTVVVSDFLPSTSPFRPGIKGSFSGTLYNETNPLDSLVIQKGSFSFRKLNWYNSNQCAE